MSKEQHIENFSKDRGLTGFDIKCRGETQGTWNRIEADIVPIKRTMPHPTPLAIAYFSLNAQYRNATGREKMSGAEQDATYMLAAMWTGNEKVADETWEVIKGKQSKRTF